MNTVQKGDLVRWYLTYNDDHSIIKDVGLGVCLDVETVSPYRKTQLGLPYKIIKVYRNKFNDIIKLSESDVERLTQ